MKSKARLSQFGLWRSAITPRPVISSSTSAITDEATTLPWRDINRADNSAHVHVRLFVIEQDHLAALDVEVAVGQLAFDARRQHRRDRVAAVRLAATLEGRAGSALEELGRVDAGMLGRKCRHRGQQAQIRLVATRGIRRRIALRRRALVDLDGDDVADVCSLTFFEESRRNIAVERALGAAGVARRVRAFIVIAQLWLVRIGVAHATEMPTSTRLTAKAILFIASHPPSQRHAQRAAFLFPSIGITATLSPTRPSF